MTLLKVAVASESTTADLLQQLIALLIRAQTAIRKSAPALGSPETLLEQKNSQFECGMGCLRLRQFLRRCRHTARECQLLYTHGVPLLILAR